MFGWTLGKPKQTLRGLTTRPFEREEFVAFSAGMKEESDRSLAILWRT